MAATDAGLDASSGGPRPRGIGDGKKAAESGAQPISAGSPMRSAWTSPRSLSTRVASMIPAPKC